MNKERIQNMDIDCHTPKCKSNSLSTRVEHEFNFRQYNLDNECFVLNRGVSSVEEYELLDEMDINIRGCLSNDSYKMVDSVIYIIENMKQSLDIKQQKMMVDYGLITANLKTKLPKMNVSYELFSRLISRIGKQCINIKYLTKVLRLCNVHMVQYDNKKILESICIFYSYINRINKQHKFFDDDIILFGDKYLAQYDKRQNDLLLSGWLKELSDIQFEGLIIIPSDVENEVFKYMSYGIDIDIFDRLCYLSTMYQNSTMTKIMFEDRLPQWVNGCDCKKPQQLQLKSVQTIRRILAGAYTNDFLIKQVVDSGVINRLKEFLISDSIGEEIQYETMWLLTNICSGSTENTSEIINDDIIPLIINLLQSKSINIQYQSVWCLGNIAGDGPLSRDLLLDHKILNKIKKICKNYKHYLDDEKNKDKISKLSVLRDISWVLANFCRGTPRIEWEYIEIIQDCFSWLINVNDAEVLTNFGWSLSYLTGDISENDLMIENMKNNNYIQKVIDLLSYDSNDSSVGYAALRSIGNIIANTDMNTQYILNYDLLNKLKNILHKMSQNNAENNKIKFKQNICWTISNITAGSSDHIQQVIDNKIFEILSNILRSSKHEIAKESLWAIANAASGGTTKQISYLVNKCNIVDNVCFFLNKLSKPKLILVALECIENILNVDENTEYRQYIQGFISKNIFESIVSNDEFSNEINEKASNILAKLNI